MVVVDESFEGAVEENRLAADEILDRLGRDPEVRTAGSKRRSLESIYNCELNAARSWAKCIAGARPHTGAPAARVRVPSKTPVALSPPSDD